MFRHVFLRCFIPLIFSGCAVRLPCVVLGIAFLDPSVDFGNSFFESVNGKPSPDREEEAASEDAETVAGDAKSVRGLSGYDWTIPNHSKHSEGTTGALGINERSPHVA